jgi:hypothetical protein
MREIIVLGGYGHLGQACVAKLVQATRARIVVAGRSIQRAEQVAAAYRDRARPAYSNVVDRRTLQTLLPGAAAIVDCCGGDPLNVLDLAIQARVPFIGLTSFAMEERTYERLHGQAWKAQVPLIVSAGAVPGLPGVLADYLVRRFPSLYEIRIASTGPWLETATAKLNHKMRRPLSEDELWYRRALRWRFPEPIGGRWVRPARSSDLVGFVETHCLERLIYLEPDQGPIARGMSQILQRKPNEGFSLVAEATPERDARGPRPRVALQASDPLSAAAAATSTLLFRLLRGRMPGGFFTPYEALNPASFLEGLEKHGVRVTFSSAEA